jgi:gamma-glutamylputrescine oxidase
MPRVLVVCGFSGHGMTFGLRLGQLLTEAVVHGAMPIGLNPYQLARPTLKKWSEA